MAARWLRWVVLLAMSSGCVRAGFAVGDGSAATVDRESPTRDRDSAPNLEAALPPGPSATAAHDTCATALTVDATKLPISIGVSTSGAHADYSFQGCTGLADVVLRLTNLPAGLIIASCTGGGRINFGYRNDGGCGAAVNGWGHWDCTGMGFTSVSLARPTAHLIVCRDPAAGAALLTLKNL